MFQWQIPASKQDIIVNSKSFNKKIIKSQIYKNFQNLWLIQSSKSFQMYIYLNLLLLQLFKLVFYFLLTTKQLFLLSAVIDTYFKLRLHYFSSQYTFLTQQCNQLRYKPIRLKLIEKSNFLHLRLNNICEQLYYKNQINQNIKKVQALLKFMNKIKNIVFFILLGVILCSFAKQEQNLIKERIEEQDQVFIKKERLLQSCSPSCLQCSNNFCLQCMDNTVLPFCYCADGFYQDSFQSCKKCGQNCKNCYQQQCQICNEHYQVDNGLCVCNGNCDNTVLYYTTRVGSGLQSIVITFNQIIGIQKTTSQDINSAFSLSYDNCSILIKDTQQIYGVFDASDLKYGGCYIRQSQQNQFIIMLTQKLDQTNILKAPIIDSTQILVFNGIPLYKSLQQGSVATTTETFIGSQLGYISKICYFEQSKVFASLSESNLKIQINTINNLSSIFQASSGNIKCEIVNSSVPQITFDPCSSQNGLQMTTQQFIDKSVLQVSVECSFLGYNTKDIVEIVFTSQNSQNIRIEYNDLFFTSNFKDSFETNVSFLSDTVLKQIQFSYIIYPATTFSVSSQLLQDRYNSKLQIIGSSVMTEQIIFIQLIASAQNTVSTLQLAVQYLSSFSLDVDQKVISNFFPNKGLTIKANLVDNDVTILDISQFQLQWYCISEDTQTECKDRNQNIIVLGSSLTLQVNPKTFNLNGKFTIFILAKRNTNPNAQQIAVTKLDTGQTQLTIVTDMNSLQQINYQDIIFIELKYETNLYITNQSQTYKAIILNSLTQKKKTIESISNKLSFIIQDLFPNLDMTVQNNFQIQFQVYDQTLDQIFSSNTYVMQIRQPPQGCKLALSPQAAFQIITISVNSCNLNGQDTQYQFFYYSSKEQQDQEIQTSGIIVNRRMLSLISQNTQITAYLPPGNIIVMVITIGPNNLRSNFTQTATIQDNNWSQAEYEKYLQNQYIQTQQQSTKSIQVFGYQYITNAVEYYESQNLNYIPSDSINQLKNQIIQQLIDSSWQNEDDQVYLLSTQINIRIKQSKIKITLSSSLASVNAIEKQVQNILQKINQSQLDNQQRQYYQEILSSIIQNYMKDMNNLNNWTPDNCQNAIEQSNNIMQGIAETMIVNQQPIQVITEGDSLLVDRVNYITLLSKYYDDSKIEPDQSQYSQSYYVLIQTWPTTHPLYRDELQQINEQYYSKSTPQQLSLLQKTYPIIIPKILEDDKRRRQLSTADANLPGPFQLQFPTQDEKLQCIQRNLNGQWVSNSCKTSIKIINQQRIVNCSCKTPDPTSIITDITDLFNNQNVQDIFNGEGFWRIFHLSNWYEYAPIWTIIGLNIFFIALLIIGYKYDKLDERKDLKKAFLFYDYKKGESQTIGQESLFMQIKNLRTQQNKLSNNVLSLINSQKTQEHFEDQEVNNNNNNNNNNNINKVSLEFNKKSIFAKGDKVYFNNQIVQNTPIINYNSEHLTSLNIIQQNIREEVQNGNSEYHIDYQTKVLSEKLNLNDQIIQQNVSQNQESNKNISQQIQEQNQNDKEKKFGEKSQQDNKIVTQNTIKQGTKLKTQQEMIRIDLNESNGQLEEKKSLRDLQEINSSQISTDFQKIDEKENYQKNDIQNFVFNTKKQFKQDYSIQSSNLDKKYQNHQQISQQQLQITPENQVNMENITPTIENNKTLSINQNNNSSNHENNNNNNTPQIEGKTSQQIDVNKLFTQEDYDNFQQTPQSNYIVDHNFLLKTDQIQLDQFTNQEENILKTQTQNFNNWQLKQEIPIINNNQTDEEAMKIQHKNEIQDQKACDLNQNDQKKIDQKRQKEIELTLFLKAKEKLQLYLQKETIIRAALAYHIFFQTFIIYNNKVSRVLRFTIYYNRLIWLLAINSVFGVKLSVVQVLVLSIVSTVIIQIVTTILMLLYFRQKLKIFGVIITSLFLIFCYYSILVVISGQQSYDANIWILSYFSTLFLSDYVFGLAISFAMLYLTKKYIDQIQDPLYLNILGSALLIQSFQY
ncbi:transmembrane protein, putative (macronuclear) [Tetrahymena thermophila SB210]|uniref:Transmembrane protein, putative n=1 Tax=Tetrahymena thermophila (strain SB210) TaxID=312017 RepID=Q236R5_TETTS|nr:transmembrane protein, putative [Tetrahymena thermophila SB210]EAR92435.2 transmembrane protein, putative [Tetrahymena thermophila SB210]|eukprot:XP_001012680.2 transmembrane protein, putative [Tetrahymena thermophila SB210]